MNRLISFWWFSQFFSHVAFTESGRLTPPSHSLKGTYLANKKLYGPFSWMGFNCLKARATSRRQFTFYHYFPRNSWYSFYQHRKDERLSQPWSHPVVLNMGISGKVKPQNISALNIVEVYFQEIIYV